MSCRSALDQPRWGELLCVLEEVVDCTFDEGGRTQKNKMRVPALDLTGFRENGRLSAGDLTLCELQVHLNMFES